MTEPVNKNSPLSGMPFDEAFARLLQTKPEEMADAHEKVRKRQEEIAREADAIEAEIKRGARPAGKRFRL